MFFLSMFSVYMVYLIGTVLGTDSNQANALTGKIKTVNNEENINWDSLAIGEMVHVLDTNKVITLLSVNNETKYSNNTAWDKRVNCPSRSRTWRQTQLVNHGDWWSKWSLAGDWGYCNLDPNQGSSYTFTKTWTIGYGVTFDAGVTFEELLNLFLGVGIEITKSIGTTQGMNCACWGKDPVCVWEQSRLTWSDSQWQECTMYADCNGGFNECSPWSKYHHANAPVKDDYNAFHWGCSSGYDNCLPN